MPRKPVAKKLPAAPAAQPPMPERQAAPASTPARSAPRKPAPKKEAPRGRDAGKHHDERARDARAQESRDEDFGRVDENAPYERPTSLKAPPERPGFEQRWVHVGLEKPDEKNVARRLREGWRPRLANTVPKNFHMPRIAHGRFSGYIGVEGMVLMEMPVAMAKKRRQYFAGETHKRTKAIDDELRRANAGAQTGGFGPITRAQKSQLVREVAPGKEDGGDGDEVTL